MKNFILKNAMVVAAMAIAAGSYGLMSFGTNVQDQEFGMQVENPGTDEERITWVPLENLEEGQDYDCTLSSDICKGYFEPHQIDPATNLPYENEVPVSTTEGTFEL